jgi:hypothetical protein
MKTKECGSKGQETHKNLKDKTQDAKIATEEPTHKRTISDAKAK